MGALDPEVKDAIWAGFEPLIPAPPRTHPLGCHRRRAPDRDCFDVIVVRLATGCSWEDAERLCGNKVSDTTARSRRDEWIEAGLFAMLSGEALAGYDKIVGLNLNDVSVDGSLHKSPCGGEGTGKNPTDRAKLGWKWSILCDANGIPIGVAIGGANRNDSVLLAPTLDDTAERGLLIDIETIWLDRGYDSDATRERLVERGLHDAVIAQRRSGDRPDPPRSSRWDCAGPSSAPTRGCRTLASSVAIRTARSCIDLPSSLWLSSSCSRPSRRRFFERSAMRPAHGPRSSTGAN